MRLMLGICKSTGLPTKPGWKNFIPLKKCVTKAKRSEILIVLDGYKLKYVQILIKLNLLDA